MYVLCKACYKILFSIETFCKFIGKTYLCNVFFIVLDLRLTKRLAVWEDSLFLCLFEKKRIIF